MNKLKRDPVLTHKFFYSIVSAAIRVFIPIIIYKQTNSIQMAMFFIVFYSSIAGIMTLALKKLIAKKPFLCMTVSILPLLLIQVILAFFEINIYSTIILGVLLGLSNAFYCSAINIYFSLTSKKIKAGRFAAWSKIGSIVYTIFTGYILGSQVFDSLLVLSVFSFVIFAISMLPLLKHRKEINSYFKTTKEVSLIEANKKLAREGIFYAFTGVVIFMVGEILPLYLYYNNLSVESVGYVVALTQAAVVAVGYLSDFMIKKKIIELNYLLFAVIPIVCFILVIFIDMPVLLYVISLLLGVSGTIGFSAYFKVYCDKTKRENLVINGHILRDFYNQTPRNLFYSVFFIIPSFPVLFVLGSLSSIGMYVFRLKEKTK